MYKPRGKAERSPARALRARPAQSYGSRSRGHGPGPGCLRHGRAASPPASSPRRLLDFDFGADFLELLLDVVRLVLRDPFLDRLGSALDEVFRFFEAERGDLADDLDHVDLVGADFSERARELGLFFRRRRRAASRRAAAREHRHRCRRAHAELRFERLHELRELEDADALDVFDDLLLRYFGHCLLLMADRRSALHNLFPVRSAGVKPAAHPASSFRTASTRSSN